MMSVGQGLDQLVYVIREDFKQEECNHWSDGATAYRSRVSIYL